MNGKLERAGAIIIERARVVIINIVILPHFWLFVVQSVVTVMNLMPSKVNPEGKSPYEFLYRVIPSYLEEEIKLWIKYLRNYFCTAYYYIKLEKRTKGDKFELRSRPGKLIGYDNAYGRIYYVWDLDNGKIIRASAMKFIEINEPESDEEAKFNYVVIFSDQII